MSKTALINYEEQLALAAGQYAEAEQSSATGDFFGLKGGNIAWGGNPIKGNKIGVIIVDAVFENVFYEGQYDPDEPQSPTCFAFGRDENELSPFKTVVEAGQAQHDKCAGCPNNEWGSADRGKGKACRNTRRLALLPAGEFDKDGNFEPFEDADALFSSGIGYMKLPVTSVKNYANYVKQIATTFKRPPFAVFTQISTVPDAKSQFKVLFEALALLDSEFIPYAIKKNEEISGSIIFPYSLTVEEPEKELKKKKKAKY